MVEILNKIKQLPKNKVITILPHDCIDVDSIFSAILLSKLLSHFNIQNEIVIFDLKIDKSTKYFLNKIQHDTSKYVTEIEDESRLLFLVDHYDTIHKGIVVGCIDHHPTSKVFNYNIYLNKLTSSTSYIIYNLIKEAGVKITEEIITLVSYAMLVDTCSFKSTKIKFEEKEEIIKLLKENNFDVEEMLQESLCLQNISNMPLEEILYNGVKKYNYNNHIVKSSYIQIKSLNVPNIVFEKLQEIVIQEGLEMWVFIIFDLVSEKSKICYITKSAIIYQNFNCIVSRGQDIMPKVELMLKK